MPLSVFLPGPRFQQRSCKRTVLACLGGTGSPARSEPGQWVAASPYQFGHLPRSDCGQQPPLPCRLPSRPVNVWPPAPAEGTGMHRLTRYQLKSAALAHGALPCSGTLAAGDRCYSKFWLFSTPVGSSSRWNGRKRIRSVHHSDFLCFPAQNSKNQGRKPGGLCLPAGRVSSC